MTSHIVSSNSYASVFLAFILSIGSIAFSQAETSEEKGLSIAKEMKSRDQGWESANSELIMILHDGKNRQVVRNIRTKTLEVENDGDKAITIFDTPLDVKGTAFLSHSHVVGSDDQWLFLPALKRIKRIASRNKSGPFLGSEFAYEDLSSFEVDKFTYRYLRDEIYEGNDCFVVEMIPTDKYSGYKRMNVWLDKAHYRMHKVDYFDRRDALRKTLINSDFELHLGKFWRPQKQQMVSHKTGKRTDIERKNVQFRVGLTDADFTQNRLRRAR